jgi:hypothetical protein
MLLIAVAVNIKKLNLNDNTLFRYMIPVIALVHLFTLSAIIVFYSSDHLLNPGAWPFFGTQF